MAQNSTLIYQAILIIYLDSCLTSVQIKLVVLHAGNVVEKKLKLNFTNIFHLSLKYFGQTQLIALLSLHYVKLKKNFYEKYKFKPDVNRQVSV